MRISDWSSDVCSSDLDAGGGISMRNPQRGERLAVGLNDACTIHIRGRNADRITVAAVSPQGAFPPLERGSAPGEWKLRDIADLGEEAEIPLYITYDRTGCVARKTVV